MLRVTQALKLVRDELEKCQRERDHHRSCAITLQSQLKRVVEATAIQQRATVVAQQQLIEMQEELQEQDLGRGREREQRQKQIAAIEERHRSGVAELQAQHNAQTVAFLAAVAASSSAAMAGPATERDL